MFQAHHYYWQKQENCRGFPYSSFWQKVRGVLREGRMLVKWSGRVWIIFFKHYTILQVFDYNVLCNPLHQPVHGAAEVSIFLCTPPKRSLFPSECWCPCCHQAVPADGTAPAAAQGRAALLAQGTSPGPSIGSDTFPLQILSAEAFTSWQKNVTNLHFWGLTENSLPDFSQSSHKTF